MTHKHVAPNLKITRCPTCGSEKIRHVIESWEYEAPKGRCITPPIPHWRCGHCGERLFGRQAQEILDRWRSLKRSRKIPESGTSGKPRSKSIRPR